MSILVNRDTRVICQGITGKDRPSRPGRGHHAGALRRSEIDMSSVGRPNYLIMVRAPWTESMIEIRTLLTEIPRGSIHPPAFARGSMSSLRLAPGS